ncbi:DUF3693 domain-containing protein [Xanthomonas vasicola]|uniref:DUF3693 domain-containing protein n=1 Tax=Xanthomonas vasicola TaxID=56459 RepID=UPI00037FECB4|nr:DUF3693 domain-containing protein [Xanthomonas vasicola]MDO6950524.1 DUF3693 domain-containing protein [Xanthomonas vasicola]
MSAENELIDLVRAGGKFSSDNALAQKLGVTRAMVSSWRSGRYAMPDDQIAQLCALAKLDGASWMARIHTERAGSATERALWQSILDRLAPITAVVGALAVVVVGVHAGAHEALLIAFSPAAITPTFYTLCEMGYLCRACPASLDLALDQDLPAEPCGTDRPLARLASSRWSRSLWWILANGETATSAEQPVAVPALRDKALSVGAMPLHANHLHALWTTLSQ